MNKEEYTKEQLEEMELEEKLFLDRISMPVSFRKITGEELEELKKKHRNGRFGFLFE